MDLWSYRVSFKVIIYGFGGGGKEEYREFWLGIISRPLRKSLEK